MSKCLLEGSVFLVGLSDLKHWSFACEPLRCPYKSLPPPYKDIRLYTCIVKCFIRVPSHLTHFVGTFRLFCLIQTKITDVKPPRTTLLTKKPVVGLTKRGFSEFWNEYRKVKQAIIITRNQNKEKKSSSLKYGPTTL